MIEAPSIGEAWDRAVIHVLSKGELVVTEDGETTLETDEIVIKVARPEDGTRPTRCPFRQAALDAYRDQLLNGTGNVFDYNYHARIFQREVWFGGHMRSVCHNQIDDHIIPRLSKTPMSRRGIVVVWELLDGCGPCLQWIQFLIRNGKLQMKVLFRSNDVLMAMYANMYALIALQRYVADALAVPVGSYTHIVTVPHIYINRDANEVNKWR